MYNTRVVKTIRRIPYTQFIRIYTKVPRLCVDVVILTKEGIVLSKRDIEPSKNMWHIPGGTVLLGERLTDTAQRVALEETGLTVNIKNFLGITEFFTPTVIGQSVSMTYLVTPISGNLRGSSQGKEVRFFKTLPKKIIIEHREFIQKNNLLKNI